jgi:adenosine deaminase
MESIVPAIRVMPKVDLHLHLDGSVKSSTLLELAVEQGQALPVSNLDQLDLLMKVQGSCASLAEYLEKFHFVGAFLHSASALERVAYELVEQASEQYCRYIEVRFAPQLHRALGLSVEEVIHHVLQGLKKGQERFGVKSRGIAICLRGHADTLNIEVVEVAYRFLDKGLVAVDLAGAEAAYPAHCFEGVFAIARKKDMPTTIHAGEAGGAGNIYDAVTKLGATRIGHGVRLKECDRAFKLVWDRGIPLELCPISNIQTKAVSDWSSYPVKHYFDEGIRITINTDNLTVSDTNLTKEYEVLQQKFGFTNRELGQLVLNGVEAAFLPDHEKRSLYREMEQELETVVQSYSMGI